MLQNYCNIVNGTVHVVSSFMQMRHSADLKCRKLVTWRTSYAWPPACMGHGAGPLIVASTDPRPYTTVYRYVVRIWQVSCMSMCKLKRKVHTVAGLGVCGREAGGDRGSFACEEMGGLKCRKLVTWRTSYACPPACMGHGAGPLIAASTDPRPYTTVYRYVYDKYLVWVCANTNEKYTIILAPAFPIALQ